jgi:chloramphenicol O-acetyltransferase
VDGKQLQQQYKHHIGDFSPWDQKEHARYWMLFEQNVSPFLSIDETAVIERGVIYHCKYIIYLLYAVQKTVDKCQRFFLSFLIFSKLADTTTLHPQLTEKEKSNL